ncbi:hypothetical protein CCM_07803 [Cordyceps militaris CM01]|uniref:Secreted protein n=1 Tax=Cordyceps militaris (strain CM01) TaxID=983644 RepID=G3JQP7_CORMM|nr:uncharacterized protein CCM_07803 [Cordyceps militaris CM01]EGX89551.1 hypothetical protein CCM_07803 [Cordyceps militaris CM01]
MQLGRILAMLLCTAVAVWAKPMQKRTQHPCGTPENCNIKCEDGAFYLKQPKQPKQPKPPLPPLPPLPSQLFCNGTHHDFRWGGMVCLQTVGPKRTETKDRCSIVNGTICAYDDRAVDSAVCLAEMAALPLFEEKCRRGIKRWSAVIDYPDLRRDECPGGRHIPPKYQKNQAWNDTELAADPVF